MYHFVDFRALGSRWRIEENFLGSEYLNSTNHETEIVGIESRVKSHLPI